MNDLKKSKNYAVAKGPVNRRTTVEAPVAKPVVAQAVLQRVSMAHAKRRLGTPLSQRVAASTQPATAGALPGTTAIVQAIGCTICAMGLGLGVIQSSVLVMGVSAVALGGVALWAVISRRVQPAVAASARVAVAEVADAQALAQLDAVMEKMAAEAPQATVDSLTQLKESIVRCTALLSAGEGDAGLASEESLYLREAVRRYIPDSINSCLQVPLKDRASLVIDGSKPALDLLQDQLQMIQQQLDAREARLTQFAGEALLRQQRFLAAKANGG
nr:hypothetical protein [Rhodoferax sp.]